MRSAGADTPSADRMGGTSPSFIAMKGETHMLHARAGVMLGLRFMADVLQGIAGAGGERDEHRGTALALTQAGRPRGAGSVPCRPRGAGASGRMSRAGTSRREWRRLSQDGRGPCWSALVRASGSKEDPILARTVSRSIPMAASASRSRPPNRPAPAPSRACRTISSSTRCGERP